MLAAPTNPVYGVKITSMVVAVMVFVRKTKVPPTTSEIAQFKVSPSTSEPVRVTVTGVPCVVLICWEYATGASFVATPTFTVTDAAALSK